MAWGYGPRGKEKSFYPLNVEAAVVQHQINCLSSYE